MPIYDVNLNPCKFLPNLKPGKPISFDAQPFPRSGDDLPGKLFDANGNLINDHPVARYYFACDTETGEVWHCVVADGQWMMNEETKRPAITSTIFPAPLRYVLPEEK